MIYTQTPTTHPTDELPPPYLVESVARLPETIHKIDDTCGMPGGVYYMLPLDCLEEALLFTGPEAYLMKSRILADQWYLFVPFGER